MSVRPGIIYPCWLDRRPFPYCLSIGGGTCRPEVLFSVAFIWGIHPAIVKIGLVSLPFVAYNALRLLLAAPSPGGGVPPAAWLSVAYSGILGICVGNFLWVWGVGKIGSARTSLFGNISPVFAVASGYLLLGEEFGLLQLVGAVVIFWGVYRARSAPGKAAEGQ